MAKRKTMIKLPVKKPLVTEIYTADPSAHVFENKIYIYPSHDLDHDNIKDDTGDQYDMTDYHVFSIDETGTKVTDHGEALHMKDVPWVKKQMWAPDVAYKNGTYYFYFPAKDKDEIFRIGVATSKTPYGPFIARPEPIKGSFSIDPAVFIDDDGKAYMYNGGLWGGQLEKWQTDTFIPDKGPQDASEIAIGPRVALITDDMLEFTEKPKNITILDENGKPFLAGDNEKRYFEGPWMHKYNGLYYLSYSTGDTHYLVYATGTSPYGPFQYKGRILNPVIGWTTHHSIIQYKGKWYLFYHDSSLSNGKDNKRCVKYTELEYENDGSIKTIDP